MDNPLSINQLISFFEKNLIDDQIISATSASRHEVKIKNIEEILNGRVSEKNVDLLNFKEGEKEKSIVLHFFPWKEVQTHTNSRHNADTILFVPAVISAEGKLSPKDDTIPFFNRKFLEPTEFTPLGKMSYYERIASILSEKSFDDWNSYLTEWLKVAADTLGIKRVRKLNFKDLYYGIRNMLKNDHPDMVTLPIGISLFDQNSDQYIKGTLDSYSNIKHYYKENSFPFILFQRSLGMAPKFTPELMDKNVLTHLGSISSSTSLNYEQRSGVEMFCSLKEEGGILVVKGPPGTGKTTLIQSIVASKIPAPIVSSVAPFDSLTPELILGTSVNNQAVTNILESLDSAGDHYWEKRWIDGLGKIGVYIGNSKTNENAIKSLYTKDEFLEKLYTIEFANKSKHMIMRAAGDMYKKKFYKIEDVLSYLHKDIIFMISQLDEVFLNLENIKLEIKNSGIDTNSLHTMEKSLAVLNENKEKYQKELDLIENKVRSNEENRHIFISQKEDFIKKFTLFLNEEYNVLNNALNNSPTFKSFYKIYKNRVEKILSYPNIDREKVYAVFEGVEQDLKPFLSGKENPSSSLIANYNKAIIKLSQLLSSVAGASNNVFFKKIFKVDQKIKDIFDEFNITNINPYIGVENAIIKIEDEIDVLHKIDLEEQTLFKNSIDLTKLKEDIYNASGASVYKQECDQVRSDIKKDVLHIQDFEKKLTMIKTDIKHLENNIKVKAEKISGLQQNISLLMRKIVSITGVTESEIYELKDEDISKILDKSIRYKIFQYSMRFWETLWAYKATSDTLRREFTRFNKKKIIVFISHLFPCIVMSMNKVGKIFAQKGSSRDYEDMFGFFDNIIIDEAGQVSPARGSHVLAYGKRALIVGDENQLEPITNIDESISKSNLLGFSNNNEEAEWLLDFFSEKNLVEYNNSMMRQMLPHSEETVSRDHQTRKGVMLTEHWRCHRDIIEYCNELVYAGELIPMKKPIPKFLDPINYYQVFGRASRYFSSLQNREEAKAIAFWIEEFSNAMIEHYKTSDLSDIVAIVTPYRAQGKLISNMINTKLGPNNIICGTIHSLQGAEKPIILFSPVVGVEDSHLFINQKENLMNVAVSRAKESVIFFGDMDLFIKDINCDNAFDLMHRWLLSGQNGFLPRSSKFFKKMVKEIYGDDVDGAIFENDDAIGLVGSILVDPNVSVLRLGIGNIDADFLSLGAKDSLMTKIGNLQDNKKIVGPDSIKKTFINNSKLICTGDFEFNYILIEMNHGLKMIILNTKWFDGLSQQKIFVITADNNEIINEIFEKKIEIMEGLKLKSEKGVNEERKSQKDTSSKE